MEILTIIFKVLFYLFILFISSGIYTLYLEKCNTREKKDIVLTIVKYVEQVYKMMNGKEKFTMALTKASVLLAKKNIKVDEEELTVLIEEAVLDCKELFEKNKQLKAGE